MKSSFRLILLASLLAIVNASQAAGSGLRVTCEGDDVGAEVLINGKFRGECPLDMRVSEGTLKLLVRKKVDAQRERVFEQEIRMGADSSKKVEAHLGEAKLNAGEAARQAENSRRVKGMPFDALLKEAAAGNSQAMSNLAFDYFRGKNGAPKDKTLGAPWFRKAAESGNVDAMEMWSAILADGVVEGIPKDLEASLIWARKAADTGEVDAMKSLAKRYQAGKIVPKNDTEALRWYRRAADKGDLESVLDVGTCYYRGWGVPQSDEEAVAWWRKAAEGGYRTAMYLVGRSYAKGEGVAISEEQAIYWWHKAVEGKYPHSSSVAELKKRGLL